VQNFTPPTRAFATGSLSLALDYDPFWSNVVLAMHMDDLTDLKGHTITNTNSISNNTTTYKYGTAAAALVSASSKYLSSANSSDWNFSGGDFSVELWVNFSSTGSMAFAGQNISGSYSWIFALYNGNTLRFAYSTNGSSTTLVDASFTPTTGVWYHLAAVRSGSSINTFVNGTLSGSASISGSLYSSTDVLAIGRNSDAGGTWYLNGYLDDLRITKGVARYTGNFVPPQAAFSSNSSLSSSTNVGNIVKSGLVCYLDAGDINSCSGSGAQMWANIVDTPADGAARAAYDFYLGNGSNSTTLPTFIGVAGGKSANDYFYSDGNNLTDRSGDCFRLAGSNTTFINSLHKANATFTIEIMLYGPATILSASTARMLLSTISDNAYYTGFDIGYNDTDYSFYFRVRNSNGTTPFYQNFSSKLKFSAWNWITLSIDAQSGSHIGCFNGQVETFTGTYSGPATADAYTTLRIGQDVDNSNRFGLVNGMRIAVVRIYNRALTKAELDQNFNAVRSRYGI
jgi:hypothetical protein